MSKFSNRELVQLVPDDAFYYLKIAKNSNKIGIWSFDGLNPTTGFQPLHAFILKGIYLLSPELEFKSIFLAVGALTSLSIFASLFVISKLISKFYGRKYLSIVYLIFLGKFVMLTQFSMMESWLTLLFSSLAFYFNFIGGAKCKSKTDTIILFSIGVLGTLSRVDFILLAIPIFLIAFTYLSPNYLWQILKLKSFVILVGSVTGLLLVSALNWSISGKFSQGSTEIKLFWTSKTGINLRQPLNMFAEVIIPDWDHLTRTPKILLVITLVSLAMIAKSRKFAVTFHSNIFNVAATSALTVLFYIGLYSFNSQGFQAWYSVNFIVVGILLVVHFLWLISRVTRIALPIYCIMMLLPSVLTSISSIQYYTNQSDLYDAAIELRTFDNSVRVGSWNAGILGYFSDKPIFNIDGLVNDTAVKYIKKEKLMDYLVKDRIAYVADYESMLTSDVLKIRGGYNLMGIEQCFAPIKKLSTSKNVDWDTILYKIDLDCVKEKG